MDFLHEQMEGEELKKFIYKSIETTDFKPKTRTDPA
jgi:hypothetical protein